MQRKEQFRFLVYTVAEIMSAVWTVISLGLDLLGFGTKYPLSILALIGFVVFFALVVLHLYQQRSIIQGMTPHIRIYGTPSVHDDQFNAAIPGRRGRDTNIVIEYQVVQVKFTNSPIDPTKNNIAQNVVAQIAYYDKDRNLILGSIYGHWSDSGYPKNVNVNSFLSTELLSNGLPQSLDLAIRFKSSDEIYAFNYENYAQDFYFGWRDQNFNLTENEILIQVKLIGEMVKEEFWFRLYTKGKKKELEIEELTKKK